MPVQSEKIISIAFLLVFSVAIASTLWFLWSASVSIAGLACLLLGGIISLVIRAPAQPVFQQDPGLKQECNQLKSDAVLAKQMLTIADQQGARPHNPISKMGHELRTPLHSILGYAELLEEIAIEQKHNKMIPDLRNVRVAANQLLHRISDLVVLSAIEDGTNELFWDEFEVNSILEEVFNTLESEIARRHNTLEISKPTRPGKISTDRNKLRHILLTLISFSSIATQQGNITLTMRRKLRDEHAFLFFEIKDNGIRLDTGKIAVISADKNSHSRNIGESELSLLIVRKYVELLGGELTTAGKRNSPARFHVVLPDWRSYSLTKSSASRQILVFSDDSKMLLTRGVLFTADIEMLKIHDINLALELIKNASILVVVLELTDEKILDIIDAAKEAMIPIVGLSPEPKRLDAIKLGINAFLQQPFNPWIFTNTIKTLIQDQDFETKQPEKGLLSISSSHLKIRSR